MFCDKTGTLTKNLLVFRHIESVSGVEAGFPKTPDDYELARCILLCNTAYRGPKKDLQCSNQDELVLLEALEKEYDCYLRDRGQDNVTIEIGGVSEIFEVLKINHYSSERKRMSVIVKSTKDGRIINYAKGADAIIKERLIDRVSDQTTFAQVEKLASE